MASPSTEFAISRKIGIYDPPYQLWEDTFESHIGPILQSDLILNNQSGYNFYQSLEASADNQIRKRTSDKSQRRLAQNREAARKCRIRKKAYVQQLESSRIKLAQIEQELERSRQQGQNNVVTTNAGSASTNSVGGIAGFEIEYSVWVEEHEKKNRELREALQSDHISDVELYPIAESGLNHYYTLFRMKAEAVKTDAFYMMSGLFRTPAERVFLWIGGFRPSDLLNVVIPQIDGLSEDQFVSVSNLRRSCQQAEDALTQGMEKLQQTLVFSITPDSELNGAMEQLDSLEGLVNQADHLREQTLRQMYLNLSTRQATLGLLALGEYLQRLRSLTPLWLARPRQPEI
jgi:transcription factor TGA